MPKEPTKKQIFNNYDTVILYTDKSGAERFKFLKDEGELDMMVENDELISGTVIIKLTAETLRIATRKHFIEIK